MIFNSLPFVVFFIVFYTIYLIIDKKEARHVLILVGSYFFYGWWDWRFLSLIIFSTVLDFWVGGLIHRESSEKLRKRLLLISLTSNLGLLFIFKYFNFFVSSFMEVGLALGFSPDFHLINILLPVGISFYTFQTLSYTIDIYRRELEPETSFLTFASYVSFFPQLVAGPIVRARDLLPQFKVHHKITNEHIRIGLSLILLGYFKKLVIADSIAPLVDDAFANPYNYSSINMVLVVVFYSFQIYCDFSGYSDIAIGLGKLLGFNFPKNFNLPYFSKNFSEFWQRWHISLSSWLRDYLYIPLGGNRNGSILTLRNLMITMLLGGLWHGANLTFVVWGFLHGLYLIIQRVAKPLFKLLFKPFPRSFVAVLGVVVTYTCVNIAWVFFRSQSVSEAFSILENIASIDSFSFSGIRQKFQIIKVVLLILFLYSMELVYYFFKDRIEYYLKTSMLLQIYSACILLWMILLFGTFTSNNFIYFQF